MKTLHPTPFIVDKFWLAFRKGAHRLLALGYNRAKAKIQTTLDEESVTGLLYEAICEIIRYGNESWCQKYEAKNENPLPSNTRRGKSRRKTDLIVLHVFNRARPEFVFEAKPLNRSKSYQREDNYLGEEGLKRFLRGEYSDYTAIYPEVAMVGYAFTNSPAEWRDGLKAAINDREVELCLKPPQIDVKIIDELPVEWKSEHERESADTDIVIYHIMLDCCLSGSS